MEHILFSGSYDNQIKLLRFDDEAHTLTEVFSDNSCSRPSFLTFNPAENIVYAANECEDGAAITSYKIEQNALVPFGCKPLNGRGMCHIALKPDFSAIYAANYNSGSISGCRLNSDGSFGEAFGEARHSGGGPHKNQNAAHAHQVVFAPDGFLIAVDLGTDTLYTYDASNGTPALICAYKVPDGYGPRHLAFHPHRQCCYVITELTNHLLELNYSNGVFSSIDERHIAPSDDVSYSSEIEISKDCTELFVSVRGSDKIVRFGVDFFGRLTDKIEFPSFGGYPRMFSLSGDGKYIYIANQKGNNVTIGELNEVGIKPICSKRIISPSYISEMP